MGFIEFLKGGGGVVKKKESPEFAPNNVNGCRAWGVGIGVGGLILGACPQILSSRGSGIVPRRQFLHVYMYSQVPCN